MLAMAKGSEVFSAEYYGKYYGSARTRVHGAKEIARLCMAITSMLDWWGVPIDSVLDVGAGVGLWRDWFSKYRPKAATIHHSVSNHAGCGDRVGVSSAMGTGSMGTSKNLPEAGSRNRKNANNHRFNTVRPLRVRLCEVFSRYRPASASPHLSR